MANPTKAEENRIAAGEIRNRQTRRGDTWIPPMFLHPVWQIRISLPFDPSKHSKNQGFRIGRKGQGGKAFIIRTDGTHGGKNELAELIAQSIVDIDAMPVQAPLWIGIFLQKRNWQADAVNILDIASDAMQLATGVNDRWYCVSNIDWEMTVDRPMLHLHACQFKNEDHDTCSYCSSIVPTRLLRVTSKRRICRGCDERC
jgi:hypothetical protein